LFASDLREHGLGAFVSGWHGFEAGEAAVDDRLAMIRRIGTRAPQ